MTNGAFIAAVIHLGISYLSHDDSPNIKLAISRKLVTGARTAGPDESKLVPVADISFSARRHGGRTFMISMACRTIVTIWNN